MANPNKAFVARLAGLQVIGPDGDEIGRIRDVVVTMRTPPQPPRAVGLVVELATRRRIFVPMLRVAAMEPRAVTLVSGTINLHRFTSRPGEDLVLGSLLDSEVDVLPGPGETAEPSRQKIVDVDDEDDFCLVV